MNLTEKEIEVLNNTCWICGKTGITKHSLKGNHQSPFVPLCRKCHDKIEEVKKVIKIMKKEMRLSVTRFKELLRIMEDFE